MAVYDIAKIAIAALDKFAPSWRDPKKSKKEQESDVREFTAKQLMAQYEKEVTHESRD